MANGRGNVECHYCTHYRNKWYDRLELDEIGKEASAHTKQIKEEGEDNDARLQRLAAVWDFVDFLCAGGEQGEMCGLHNAVLPVMQGNRFCLNFSPTKKFYEHRPEWTPESKVEDTFPERDELLRPDVLYGYGFSYNRSGFWEIKKLGPS